MPTAFARALCAVLGDIIYILPTKRRYFGLSNLQHAFPDKPAEWHGRIAREASRRLVEMVLYVLASPGFSKERISSMLHVPDETRKKVEAITKKYPGQGGIALVPHFTLFEMMAQVPAIFEGMPHLGTIFRPFNNKPLNDFVKKTRERFGMELLSRKAGHNRALQIVREGGWVSILFDQNAGATGNLIFLFGRPASATDLPGLTAKKFNAPTVIAWVDRTGFWQGNLRIEELECEREPQAVTIASNQWMENYLRSGDDACADWLWTHKRWNRISGPLTLFNLQCRKNILDESATAHGWTQWPRNTRLWVRMPDRREDALMALPVLRALRTQRPDLGITLLAQARTLPLLELFPIADKHIALPVDGQTGYYASFRRYRGEYQDGYLLFADTFRAELEAWMAGAKTRFGMVRPGKARPLLTHKWSLPADIDEARTHQTRLWEMMMNHFGLTEPLDLSPFRLADSSPDTPETAIGLICGTENDPSQRWPVERWRELIGQLLEMQPPPPIKLFRTGHDTEITTAVAEGFQGASVINIADKTGERELAAELARCALVISDDAGGMHLANALGVPVAGICGPSNPVRSGPVFNAPVELVQPPECPPTGGAPLGANTALAVLEAVQRLLPAAGHDMQNPPL